MSRKPKWKHAIDVKFGPWDIKTFYFFDRDIAFRRSISYLKYFGAKRVTIRKNPHAL